MEPVKKAFTLAEVLVTLTIIGVVSAMTIPTLSNKSKEHITVNKVRNTYSILSNAYRQVISDNGSWSEWNLPNDGSWFNGKNAKLLLDMFVPYLKIQKYCGTKADNCWPSDKPFKWLNGETNSGVKFNNQAPYSTVLLQNGISLAFYKLEAVNDALNHESTTGLIYAWIKPGGEEVVGKDIFVFSISDAGVFPVGVDHTINKEKKDWIDNDCSIKKGGTGQACTAWVLYKGNMDYLHCDDLSWNGKQKCGK